MIIMLWQAGIIDPDQDSERFSCNDATESCQVSRSRLWKIERIRQGFLVFHRKFTHNFRMW